jgi:Asp-tRNA(Asn)/Glu-tRNA(Gln) amidotransferase A subunit family amidase
VHPNTATLLLAVFALRVVHRDKARAAKKVDDLRAKVRAIWDSGALIVSPTTTVRPPHHGRGAFTYRSMSFCKLGNLVDATAIAIPCGAFAPARATSASSSPTLPRSLQIIGPPGSEDAVLDLAERLTRSP